MSTSQPLHLHRQPRASVSAASPKGDSRHHRFDDEMQGVDAAVFDGFDDGQVWHVVDATDTAPKRKEYADHKRKLDVLEPQSPANDRSKVSRSVGGDRADLSSPMFVPLTPGSLESPSWHDVMADDMLPNPITPPQPQMRSVPPPTASSSRPAARSDGRPFVGVHAMGQPSELNKEHEGLGSKMEEENDVLRKLRQWLGDCVEFE
jgi:hypothetical protein